MAQNLWWCVLTLSHSAATRHQAKLQTFRLLDKQYKVSLHEEVVSHFALLPMKTQSQELLEIQFVCPSPTSLRLLIVLATSQHVSQSLKASKTFRSHVCSIKIVWESCVKSISFPCPHGRHNSQELEWEAKPEHHRKWESSMCLNNTHRLVWPCGNCQCCCSDVMQVFICLPPSPSRHSPSQVGVNRPNHCSVIK